eukprot:5450981-Amphidinium_carterae.1
MALEIHAYSNLSFQRFPDQPKVSPFLAAFSEMEVTLQAPAPASPCFFWSRSWSNQGWICHLPRYPVVRGLDSLAVRLVVPAEHLRKNRLALSCGSVVRAGQLR